MPSGVPVTGTITVYAGGTYATIDPTTGIDGWRSVATTTVRNAITTARRRQGMAVWVQSDTPVVGGSLWTLNAAPWAGDDTDWTQFTGGGSGTVTTVSVVTANGVSGTVANASTTPAITLVLGAITPTSIGSATTATTQSPGDNTTKIATTAFVTAAVVAGTTITLTGAVTGSGTTSIATTAATIATLNVVANTTAGTAAPAGVTLSALLDATVGSAQATLIARSASAWVSLPPGSTGQPLKCFGSASNLAYSDVGLLITQHSGTIVVPSGTTGTITMDLSLGDWQIPATCTGDFTLALSNPTTGQQFTVVLTQAASAHVVTWFSGITWMGAPYTAPTMPATSGAKLSATFKCISAGVYLGWWLGNSAA